MMCRGRLGKHRAHGEEKIPTSESRLLQLT